MLLTSNHVLKDNTKKTTTFPIVTITTNTDCLEELEKFFTHTKSNSGFAFIILSQLNPDKLLNFSNYLKIHTDFTIKTIQQDQEIEPNTIYIHHFKTKISIKKRLFDLENKNELSDTDIIINSFIESFVIDQLENAIIVILSGCGNLLGSTLLEIKNNGGLLIAQDPLKAKYDFLPRSAINSGLVDFILPIEQIPNQISLYWNTSKAKKSIAFTKLLSQTDLILNKKSTLITDTDIHQLLSDLNNYQIELNLQNEALLNAQQETEEAYLKYKNLYDFAPIGYFTLDETGTITEVNEIGASIFGIPKDCLLNRNFSRYVASDYLTEFYNHRTVSLKSQALESCELKLLKRKGEIFCAQLNSRSIVNSVTGQKTTLIYISDILDRQKSEELSHEKQLRSAQNDKTRTISELTYRISQEISQPITAISNYLHGSIRRIQKGNFNADDLLHALGQAANQSKRSNEILLRLKNISSHHCLQYESICINKLIEECISSLQLELLDFKVDINHRSIPSPSMMLLDKMHIQQVILNLLRNSTESMQDNGTKDPQIIIETNVVSKTAIEISILDNGPGVLVKQAHRIFEPNFTTKAYGVGLGLAVSRLIAEAHGGELVVLFDALQKSYFKISLPVRSVPM